MARSRKPDHVSSRTKRSKHPKKAAAPKKASNAKRARGARRRANAKEAPRPSSGPDAASTREAVERAIARWRLQTLEPATRRLPNRSETFSTDSGIPIPALLTAAERSVDQGRGLGFPGEFPFTRGAQATMYRGRLWTMRQFAGFGSPSDTNQRFKYLIAQGMTGLSTAFDMPALMGYDCDHPLARGEVGREGVAISSLRDFEILFDGIALETVTTSMTINASAIVALAMYIAVAEKQGLTMEQLGGTIQNDMLKEFIAQKEWIVGPRPAVRIVTDMIEFCSTRMPKWHPVSISGYHIREAGATAVQELAFTIADGVGYVDECLRRGLALDSFAPGLSFFWDVHNDFFEEIAKFRAARRLWATIMKAKGAKDPRSMMLRTHAQTAGVSLTAQQPYNNVVRVSLQALAAVLGGTQSLHTNSLDETYALPSEEAVTLALRTQQIIAHESGVDRVVDPLGGSHFVEYLTDQMEARAGEYLARIEQMGGIIRAIEEGYPQREIGESAFRHQREVETGSRLVVGVNSFRSKAAPPPVGLLQIDEQVAEEQVARLRQVKATRDARRVAAALQRVAGACRDESQNLMPLVIEAVKAYATVGEVSDVFRSVWGSYREGGFF
jgi:methylmalonyl-CoA mutase N-terminal domain/subunit